MVLLTPDTWPRLASLSSQPQRRPVLPTFCISQRSPNSSCGQLSCWGSAFAGCALPLSPLDPDLDFPAIARPMGSEIFHHPTQEAHIVFAQFLMRANASQKFCCGCMRIFHVHVHVHVSPQRFQRRRHGLDVRTFWLQRHCPTSGQMSLVTAWERRT